MRSGYGAFSRRAGLLSFFPPAGRVRALAQTRTRKETFVVTEPKPQSASAFQSIRSIDYTVIFVRDMAAMRRFYEDVLRFPLSHELSPGWIEYRIGANTLVLAKPSRTAADAPTPIGSASLQLAFKVSAAEVDQC